MWTIDELVERVGAALAAEYPGAPNGRVRDVPDRRAVRWYATTGLVDRPSAMRGRTALYETRHLLQLVAVKRLQADGRTLAEIQSELAGATDDRLAAVARVPEGLLAGGELPLGESTRPRFWTTPPSNSARGWDVGRSVPTVVVSDAPPDTPPAALTGVVLPGGVVVLVPGIPSPADRTAIASAAQPLLDLLSSRGLTDERDSS
ncbi:MerR family transcriptional regulator [Umezawaea sp.]|uniref:MerR family transcriptional regulator n=1 Tax=Umezawaea sp. TaxID=1955258 RepID=UPI002ED3560B